MLLTSHVVRSDSHVICAVSVLGGANRLFLLHNLNGRRRGGKVEITRCRRDFQGSVGAGGNLLLVFAGFHAPAFPTALFGVRQRCPVRGKAPDYMRPEADGNRLSISQKLIALN
jgi:hypothetical protein